MNGAVKTGEAPPEKWRRVAKTCRQLAAAVPAGDEPRIDFLSPGDEWKISEIRLQMENDCAGETIAAIDYWLNNKEWPMLSSDAAFFVGERLTWAARIADPMGIPPTSPEGLRGIADFVIPARMTDAIRWMTIDLYDSGLKAPRRWDERSFDDLHN